MGGAKNQHWVPQFYLRYFATPETSSSRYPNVRVWNKQKNSLLENPVGVKDICGQRYLYSPEDNAGARDWSLEQYLGLLEQGAGVVWHPLLEGTLGLRMKRCAPFVAKFIAIFHLRNVWLYRTIDHAMELRDKLYGPPSRESLASRRANFPDPTHAGRFFVHTIIKKTQSIANHLQAKPWFVVRADEPVFLTSDMPVVFTLKSPVRRGSELIFPLSPKHVLCTYGAGVQPESYVASCPQGFPEVVGYFMEQQALRFVIASTPEAARKCGNRGGDEK
ncbi:MAG: DUF4238 domain-containing protein [Rhodanobacteraceae bacterium]|nr:DUF4238 domain-containing protein [Rhodanobacteraceae bacterium]